MFALQEKSFHWTEGWGLHTLGIAPDPGGYTSRERESMTERERERKREYSMDGSFSLTFSLLFVLLLLLLFLMTKAWFFNGYSPTPCGHLSNDINSRAVRIGPIYMTKLYMTQCKLRPTFEFQGTFGQFWFNWHHYCTIWLLFFYIYVLRDMCDQKNVKRSNG